MEQIRFNTTVTKVANLVDFIGEAEENSKTDGCCNKTIELAFWILYSLIGITIFVGNTFTCIVFLTSGRLRKNFMNVFLVSLATHTIAPLLLLIPRSSEPECQSTVAVERLEKPYNGTFRNDTRIGT